MEAIFSCFFSNAIIIIFLMSYETQIDFFGKAADAHHCLPVFGIANLKFVKLLI